MKILAWILFISALLDTVIPMLRILKIKIDTRMSWGEIIERGTSEGITISIILNMAAIVFFTIYLI